MSARVFAHPDLTAVQLGRVAHATGRRPVPTGEANIELVETNEPPCSADVFIAGFRSLVRRHFDGPEAA